MFLCCCVCDVGLLSKVETEGLDGDGADVLKLKDSGGKILHPFQFLSLGIMAYLGNDQAVIQVEATKTKNLKIGGRIAYLLWRSVYAVKQVDVRNRVCFTLVGEMRMFSDWNEY